MGAEVLSSIRQFSMIRLASASEERTCSFRRSSRSRPLNLSTKTLWTGLPGAMECHLIPAASVKRKPAWLTSSVPLSLTIITGFPCRAIGASSSRTTRAPDNE